MWTTNTKNMHLFWLPLPKFSSSCRRCPCSVHLYLVQSYTIATARVAVTATLKRSCNEPNASCSSDGAWRISARETDRTGAVASGAECTAPTEAVASKGANTCVDGGVCLHQLNCHHGVGSVAAGGGGGEEGGEGGEGGGGVGAASTVSVGGGEDAAIDPSVADAIGA